MSFIPMYLDTPGIVHDQDSPQGMDSHGSCRQWFEPSYPSSLESSQIFYSPNQAYGSGKPQGLHPPYYKGIQGPIFRDGLFTRNSYPEATPSPYPIIRDLSSASSIEDHSVTDSFHSVSDMNDWKCAATTYEGAMFERSSPMTWDGDMSYELHGKGTGLISLGGEMHPPGQLPQVGRGVPFVDLRSVQQFPDPLEEGYYSDESPEDIKYEELLDSDLPAPRSKLQVTSFQTQEHDEGLGSPMGTGSPSPSALTPEDTETASSCVVHHSRNQSSISSTASVLSSKSSSAHPSRVSKRSAQKAPLICPLHPDRTFKNKSDLKKHELNIHLRPFSCPFKRYGCGENFGSKNEWKRHVSAQHLRLEFWRCDIGQCVKNPTNPRPNDFNRKDLFVQHLKRMHSPANVKSHTEKEPTATAEELNRWKLVSERHQERCLIVSRTPPPRTICVFCERTFEGDGSWEDRMEHVGKHFERSDGRSGAPGREDVELRAWMIGQGLLEWCDRSGKWLLTEKKGEAGEDADAES